MPASDLPLSGVVVADFTRILAGPLATMTLADLGADVIKIERPEVGDETRTWGPPFVGADAAYFFSVNRNKRSIVLNLKDPQDLGIARQIIERSHVLVENFRPGVMDGLGLGYETVRKTNPALVYCSMPAFSNHRDTPGNDLMMQAVGGLMSMTGGDDGEPAKVGVALLDVVAGLHAATAIAACLREGGVGRRIEVGLFEASVAALANQAANYLLGGVVPRVSGTAHPNIVPYQAFRARDGSFVMAAAGDVQYRAACSAIGRDDLAVHPDYRTNADRIVNSGALVADLAGHFLNDDVGHWVSVLLAAGVPAGPIRDLEQVFASAEGAATVTTLDDPVRGELRLVKGPITVDGVKSAPGLPPLLGEHNDEIRAWLEDG